MRVRFTQDFDYKPIPQVTIGYQAGMVATVKRDCADRAIGTGKAVAFDRLPDKSGKHGAAD